MSVEGVAEEELGASVEDFDSQNFKFRTTYFNEELGMLGDPSFPSFLLSLPEIRLL